MKMRNKHKTHGILIPALLALLGAASLTAAYISFTATDSAKAEEAWESTVDFVRETCFKNDKYFLESKTDGLIFVKDRAKVVSKYIEYYISKRPELTVNQHLEQYAKDQRVSGYIFLSESFGLEGESSEGSYEVWKKLLHTQSVENILEHPEKSYMERTEADGRVYDFAVVARAGCKGLLLCYNDVTDELNDGDSSFLRSVLEGYSFKLNGTVIIADGGRIIYSNSPDVLQGAADGFPVSGVSDLKSADTKLVYLNYGGKAWYGNRINYNNYAIYVFFPYSSVFSDRWNVMLFVAAMLIVFYLVIFVIRYVISKRNMQKMEVQLHTIKAVGSIYLSNILVHLDKMEWEELSVSEAAARVLNSKMSVWEMLDAFAENLISAKYRDGFRRFSDPNTIADRMKNRRALEFFGESISGKWHCFSIIAQDWDDSGRVTDVLILSRDIDEDKRRELDYQERLRSAIEQEKRANFAKTDFLRRMSHDIRTPINGIRGMVTISSHFLGNAEKQKECNDKIMSASGFLLDLVNDVLNMNKLESGRIKLEHTEFDLNRLIKETTDVIEIRAAETGVRLTVHPFAGEHSLLMGSPMHLRQILQNIISNAVKYNRSGGTVDVSCRELSFDGEKAQIEFVCADTGLGMSEEFQAHAFEAFAQERAETARTNFSGTGLGLPITKELVEKMGGTVRFVSEKGKGTVFTVVIPFEIAAEAPSPEISEYAHDSCMTGVRVLLVEDNELNMEIGRFLLETEGMIVTAAWNGLEAVDKFGGSKIGDFDVILMDIMMPQMNGLDAAKAIREMDRPDAWSIPIFAMTANVFEDDAESSREAGMNEHITKPIDVQKLIELMRKYINR